MRCPNCGVEIPDESNHCDRCGQPVGSGAASSGRVVQVTDNSGSTISSHNTTRTNTNTNTTSVSVNRGNSGALILALVVIVVAFVLLVGYFLVSRQDAERREEVLRTQATATAFVTATAQAATATSQAITAAYVRGVAAMEIGDWQTAHTALRSVFEHDPNYRDVKDRMGAVIAALTPTATATATETSTATPPPSSTPSPTPSPRPTATPRLTSTSTASAVPTAEATATPDLTATHVVERAEAALTPTRTQMPASTETDTSIPTAAEDAGDLLAPPQSPPVQVGEPASGSPAAIAMVQLSGSLWIDQYETTNAEYAECVAGGACTVPKNLRSNTRLRYYGEPEYADYPVIFLTWQQADDYCAFRGKRLPTEAEWLFAGTGCTPEDRRCLRGSPYPWGDAPATCERANFDNGGRNCWDGADTAPVGRYSSGAGREAGASHFGALDMAGNAWEWTSDCLDGACTQRVTKGGDWGSEVLQKSVRVENRLGYPADTWGYGGVRCVQDLAATMLSTAEAGDSGEPDVVRILVEGFGVAPDSLTDPTRRQRSAILAAEVDAKRKLAEWIAGSEIEAVTLVDQGAVTTDTIRLTVQARVPAARTVAQHYDAATGAATVQLELIVDSTIPP